MNNDLEKQHLIIEALLSNSELYGRCQSIIEPIYFHKQYQKSVKFIKEFTEKYKAMPTVEQLKAETSTEYVLLGEINKEHQNYFLDEIEIFCKQQALTQAILKGSELIEKNDGGAIEKLIKDALLVGLTKELGTDYFDNPKERLLNMKNSNGKLSTGWKTLDKELYNVNRKEILIFCGGSGAGKSVVLANIAINMAAQNLNCVYFTLELSEELVSMRLDCMIAGVKSADVYKKLDDVDAKVRKTGKISGNITVKRMPSNSRTIDLREYLHEYKIQKGFNPDVIIVDYIDIMMPNDKRISPNDLFVKDKYVTEELRALAIEYNAFLPTASQLGRSSVDSSDFNHAHIAGGISKINTADNVIGIFNSARSRDRSEIEFQLMKTRNSGGLDKKITLHYDIETLRITDLDETANSVSSQSNSVLDKIHNRAVIDQPADMKENSSNGSSPENRSAALQALLAKTKR